MKSSVAGALLIVALVPQTAWAQSQLQNLDQLDILHPIWERGEKNSAPPNGRLVIASPKDYQIDAPGVQHERQEAYSIVALDSVRDFSLTVPWRESVLTAKELHLIDGYVLARELSVSNERGSIKVEEAFIPLPLLQPLGAFLDRPSVQNEAGSELTPPGETPVAHSEPVREPVVLSGLTIEMTQIAHPERPDESFSAVLRAGDILLSDIAYTPSNRRLAFNIGTLSARELSGEADTRGKATYSLASVKFESVGDIEKLSPRKIVDILDSPTPEEESPAPTLPARFNISIENLVIDSVLDDPGNDLEIKSAHIDIALDEASQIDASGHIVDLKIDPRVFAGTPAYETAERVATKNSEASITVNSKFSGTGAPGWNVSGRGDLTIPGAFSIEGFAGLDLADGSYEASKESRRAVLLDNLVESSLSSTKISIQDLGFTTQLQDATRKTLTEIVETTVISRLGEGIGGDFRTMAIQLALGQVTPIVQLLENEGSLQLTLDTEEQTTLALALVKLFASAEPIPSE